MTETTAEPAPASRMRRLLRPALWSGGVVLVLAALLIFAAPPLVRHYAVKILAEELGRPVSIESVAINPFNLSAQVRGLRIMEADGSSEAFAFDSLRANLQARSALLKGVVLHELALAGPRLQLVLAEDGRNNWSDVIERLQAKAAQTPEAEAEDEPGLLFSIGNIRIAKGAVTVDDRIHGRQHELRDLELGLPFISNLPVKVDVFVEPSLSATINGDPLKMQARAKPFAESRDTVLDVVLDEFDLAPWVAYAPMKPSFRLPSALLSARLELSFSQPEGKTPELALRGPLQIRALELQDAQGAPVASLPEVDLELADVQPLNGRWQFTHLRMSKPEFDIVRLKNGELNLMRLIPAAPKAAGKEGKEAAGKAEAGKAATRNAAKEASTAGAAKEAAPPAAAADKAEVDFLLAHVRIRDAVVRFEDQSLAQPFRTRLEAINLDMRDLATDAEIPAEIRLDYVTDTGEKMVHEDHLRLKPFSFEGQLGFDNIQAARYAPYLATALPGGELRDGTLSGTMRYRIALDDKGQPTVDLNAEDLLVRDVALALKGSKDAALKLAEVQLRDAAVNLAARTVKVAELDLGGAAVAVVRMRDGSFDLEKLIGPQPAKAAKTDAEWTLSVDVLNLRSSSLRMEDRSAERPVVTAVGGIALRVEGYSTAKGNASKLKLDSTLNKSGKVGVSGTVSLAPLKADLKLDLRDIDLTPLQPYALEQQKISISRGRLSTRGSLKVDVDRKGGLLASFRGDLGVNNFASVDRLNSTDLLRWRSLQVGGVDARLAPLSLAVRRVVLDDFHTRLILDEEGRLNLRELQGGEDAEPAAAEKARTAARSAADAEVHPFADPAMDGAPLRAPREREGERTAELPPAPATPPPPIRVDRIEFKRGNVAFSDRFIRPNYDVMLTDLAGALDGLSSDPNSIAQLNLSARVDKTAPVSITGELNPFRQDAHLDILATVKDFELTGLSSYSGKYVGLGIARGKLSAELHYQIEDRKLTATNQIFLDQLTFGERVDSPEAMNLPVELAVSLLKNRRGEIDLHLPISGTLDDPQFSIVGLVVKMLVNLVGKAITAPFSLLASALGGDGAELSHLELAPGVSSPGEAERQTLETLAQALVDRPALRLDITGRAEPGIDSEGLRKEALQRMVRSEKLKAMIKRGVAAPSVDEIEVGAEEYPQLLEEVYDAADFKKPRNIVGLTRNLPVADMENLLLDHISIGEEELRALAQRRAQAVREWLVDEGQVPAERIFVLEPKLAIIGDEGQVVFALR